ncbi:hypothetical protein EUA60_00800 [TM7 phylum sp. oral taxon 346]|nr:hypothetical protein EUA81_00505 [TM7 phylum sp. oral taxon 356]TWP27235.1 hypothetical protein EUA60_00800 [TM7 phylum sp. oral taxon 346]
MRDWVRTCLQGRISLRQGFLVLSAVTIALFASVLALSRPAAAADAERSTKNDTVIYQKHTYTRIDKASFASGEKTKSLPIAGYDGYKYEDNEGIHLILTEGDAKTATEGQAVSYLLHSGIYDPSTQSSSTKVSIANAPEADGDDDGDNCKVNVGWFVCPATQLIADRMDGVLDIIKSFLIVHTLQTDTTKNNPIYEIWQKVRDISNVCFVLVFLLIIYAQITNQGLSNYGIKSMLPRLIIGAILVNVSYWISGALVDTSNVLGSSTQQFFTDVRHGLSSHGRLGDELSWTGVTGVVLAGGGVLGKVVVANGGIGPSLTLLTTMLVGAIVAAIVAMVVLAMRQALITLCIIVAPLAFVAYVLPSTNKYFDKWKDLFATMLLMFPLISFIFGAAQLAGYAIIANAGDSITQIIIGLAVQVAPIAITPLIIKLSGNLLGKLAGIVNNPNRGIIDRTRNWAQERAAYQAAKNRAGKSLINTDRGIFRRSPKLKRAARAINRAHGSRANFVNSAVRRQHRRTQRRKGLTAAYEAAASNNATEWDNDRYGRRSVQTVEGENEARKSEIGNTFYATPHGQALEARRRRASIHKSELDNAFDRGHQNLTHRQQLAEIDKARVQNEFNESRAGQEVDTARRTVEAHKQRISNDQQARWDTLAQTSPSYKALELSVKKSEFDAARAKEKLGKMHAEIIAQGDQSEHVVNLRGANAPTQDYVLHVARDIKRANIETNLTAAAKRAAEQALSSEVNTMMLDNTVRVDGKLVREYAAGIGNQSAVLAEYVAKSRKEAGEKIAQQAELAHHFKLDPGQIEALATGKLGTDAAGQPVTQLHVTDAAGRSYSFDARDDYVRDMSIAELFDVGSYEQKMNVIKQTGRVVDEHGNVIATGYNYDFRRSVEQAIIKTKFMQAAPALSDKSLKAVLNGEFYGDESLQYQSFRQILEGRIKTSTIANANANALAVMFADVEASDLTRTQFNKLIEDSIRSEQKKLGDKGLPNSEADARQSLIKRFNKRRRNARKMAVQILNTPTVRQPMTDQAVDVLKEFAGDLYDGDNDDDDDD